MTSSEGKTTKIPMQGSRENQRAILAASKYPSGAKDCPGSAIFVGTQPQTESAYKSSHDKGNFGGGESGRGRGPVGRGANPTVGPNPPVGSKNDIIKTPEISRQAGGKTDSTTPNKTYSKFGQINSIGNKGLPGQDNNAGLKGSGTTSLCAQESKVETQEEGPLSPGRTKGLAGFWTNQNDEVKVVKKKRFIAEVSGPGDSSVPISLAVESNLVKPEGVNRASESERSKGVDMEDGRAKNIASSFQKRQTATTPVIKKQIVLVEDEPKTEVTPQVKVKDLSQQLIRQQSQPETKKDKITIDRSSISSTGITGIIVLAENEPEAVSSDIVRSELQAKDEPVFESGRTKNLLKHWKNTEVEYNAPKTSTSRLSTGAKPAWIAEIEEAKGITVESIGGQPVEEIVDKEQEEKDLMENLKINKEAENKTKKMTEPMTSESVNTSKSTASSTHYGSSTKSGDVLKRPENKSKQAIIEAKKDIANEKTNFTNLVHDDNMSSRWTSNSSEVTTSNSYSTNTNVSALQIGSDTSATEAFRSIVPHHSVDTATSPSGASKQFMTPYSNTRDFDDKGATTTSIGTESTLSSLKLDDVQEMLSDFIQDLDQQSNEQYTDANVYSDTRDTSQTTPHPAVTLSPTLDEYSDTYTHTNEETFTHSASKMASDSEWSAGPESHISEAPVAAPRQSLHHRLDTSPISKDVEVVVADEQQPVSTQYTSQSRCDLEESQRRPVSMFEDAVDSFPQDFSTSQPTAEAQSAREDVQSGKMFQAAETHKPLENKGKENKKAGEKSSCSMM